MFLKLKDFSLIQYPRQPGGQYQFKTLNCPTYNYIKLLIWLKRMLKNA